MKILGATEFINSFINLGANKFEYNSKNLEENNVSFDDVYGDARDDVALISIFSVMNRRDDEYQIRTSKFMKRCFLSKVRDILKDIVSEEELYNIIEEKYDDEYSSFRRNSYSRRYRR